jgi:hypothetical protein
VKHLFAALLLSTPVAAAQAEGLDSAFASRYTNPEDVFVLGDYIRTATSQGQYDQAISSIEEHLVRFADDGKARLIAARLYANVGSWDLAKRQADEAIASGQLSGAETAEANEISRRSAQAIAGVEWYLDATAGVRVTDINVDIPLTSWRDRTVTGGYGELAGALRYDLGTPLGNAIVLAGRFGVTREFQDAFRGYASNYGQPDGKVVNALDGRASATFDMGLPVESIDAARLQFGVFTAYSTLHPDIRIRSVGGVVRGVVMPTVDTRFYAEYSYEDLSASDGIYSDHAEGWEVGGSLRLTQAHSIGAAARGRYEYEPGGVMTGRIEEVELSYSGRLPFMPFGTVWTQDVVVAAGTFYTVSLPPSLPEAFTGDHWRAEWTHRFQIDGHNRVEASWEVTNTDFDQPGLSGRGSIIHAFSLGYTHRF